MQDSGEMPATSWFYFYGFFVVVSEWLYSRVLRILSAKNVKRNVRSFGAEIQIGSIAMTETKRLEFELIALILLIISVQFIPPNGRFQLDIEFFILCAI